VADFSAREGTTVIEQAMSTVMSFSIMVPLVVDRVACPVCEKKEIHLFFMNLSDLGRHLDLHHVDTRIQ
jgi:hypothetical protein